MSGKGKMKETKKGDERGYDDGTKKRGGEVTESRKMWRRKERGEQRRKGRWKEK